MTDSTAMTQSTQIRSYLVGGVEKLDGTGLVLVSITILSVTRPLRGNESIDNIIQASAPFSNALDQPRHPERNLPYLSEFSQPKVIPRSRNNTTMLFTRIHPYSSSIGVLNPMVSTSTPPNSQPTRKREHLPQKQPPIP